MSPSHRPFRFGVNASAPRSKAAWMALARRLQESGYHMLVMPDHFGPTLASAPALVLAAEATTTLRVGSLVYDNDFRHPALLAQEAATVDLLTDGRYEFGIGAGWLKREYDAVGIPFLSGAERLERMAEALRIIKLLMAGSPATLDGRHYQISDGYTGLKTAQQPHPPIVIGGGGRRLLTFAAREADIVSIMPKTRPDGSGLDTGDGGGDAFDRKVAWIREAAGDRFSSLELNTLVQSVISSANPGEAVGALSHAYGMTEEAVLESPLVLVGTPEQIAETLIRRRERFGLSYITVFEKDMESMAAVISHLSKHAEIAR